MDATTSATIDSVKGLELVLQAIRTNQKHACALTFDPSSGLKLRFLDSGRVMQSGIALGVSVRCAQPPCRSWRLLLGLGCQRTAGSPVGICQLPHPPPTARPLSPAGLLPLPGARAAHLFRAA